MLNSIGVLCLLSIDMTTSTMQYSFHAGEFAPALYARVDLAKYKAGLATARNCFVDYRGGSSSRMGTKYILQCYKSATTVRLIPFQASFTVNYVLEFGDHYIRFFNNGSAILENAIVLTSIVGNLVTAANTYSVGDWVFINGRCFIVSTATPTNFTITDLFGNTPNPLASGGFAARVYTLATPYVASDLALIKFAQNVNTLVLCHPNYAPAVLTLISANNWTLGSINIGATVPSPAVPIITTTLAAGTFHYAYEVTAVDNNGQESPASPVAFLDNVTDLRTVAGSNTITWTAVPGAASYNVYKAEIRTGNAVPTGAAFGFIGNCTGVVFIDSNIPPDFTQGVPVPKNPFQGAGVQSVTITAPGSYAASAAVPSVTFGPSPAGPTASGQVRGGLVSATISSPGNSFTVGNIYPMNTGALQFVANIRVDAIGAGGSVTAFTIIFAQSFTSTFPPGVLISPGGPSALILNPTYGVIGVDLTSGGAGYTSPPPITFSVGAAAATAVLNPTSGSNPTVPSYFQDRLVLSGLVNNPQELDFSQPSSFFNFNVSSPIEADDAIQVTLLSNQLNSIKSMTPMSTGLVTLADKASWLINGGSQGSGISPFNIVANEHSYNGASDVPPIVSNFDILYVQSKGSIVRDLTFNYYAQIYTGTDISVLSSHLFYGHTILEWSYAEEPFKLVWAVRNDGILLSLTFLKEQDIIGWCHSDTTNGLFKSTCAVVESTPSGTVDTPYFVVERVVQGQTVKYIERMAERFFNGQVKNAWCVDAALQYNGAPATVFTGLSHLVGQTITGLADGAVIPPTVVNTDGTVTLSTPASLVTIGLGFICQWQTLRLDVGVTAEGTSQAKRKALGGVNIRVQDTLGLTIGKTFDGAQIPMKDLIIGNLGTQSNQVVTNLVTDDVRTIIDPSWDVPGQYCIQQSNPFPATLLGVMPEFEMGDKAQ